MRVFALLFAAYFSILACFTCVDEEQRRSEAGIAYVTATHPYNTSGLMVGGISHFPSATAVLGLLYLR